ncbi:hypothetical protein GW17_00034021 [Ensete ventricosum]|nr:hypothetical protein GW17_00034021 [Ensete ventricosum]
MTPGPRRKWLRLRNRSLSSPLPSLLLLASSSIIVCSLPLQVGVGRSRIPPPPRLTMDPSGSSSEGPGGKPPARPQKPGPWQPRIEPFFANKDHNPRELKSWARRTGFNPNHSGETASVVSDRDAADEQTPAQGLDLERGIRRRGDGVPRKPEIEPVVVRGRTNRGVEISPMVPGPRAGPAARSEKEKRKVGVEPPAVGLKDERREAGEETPLRSKSDGPEGNGHGNGAAAISLAKADEDSRKEAGKDEREVEIDFFSDGQDPEDLSGYKPPSGFRAGVTENPGLGKCVFPVVSPCLYFSFTVSLPTEIKNFKSAGK